VLAVSARKLGFCVMHVERTVHTLVMQSVLRAWISLVLLRIDLGNVPLFLCRAPVRACIQRVADFYAMSGVALQAADWVR
jgi:hypothetical protein